MFRYGERVRDVVTGYSGVVTGRAEFYGRKPCQYVVEALRDGYPFENWIDENRLEPVVSEVRNCVHIPEAEMVQEIPLGTDRKEIEKNLSAVLNAKA